jgi:hypothetical protein
VRSFGYQPTALPLSYQRKSYSTPGRIRTDNLRGVSTALLAVELQAYAAARVRATRADAKTVGLRGFEPRTSCMSGRHSGRLSYRPDAF